MDLELVDKVVAITGASSGLGRETAKAFAQQGRIKLDRTLRWSPRWSPGGTTV